MMKFRDIIAIIPCLVIISWLISDWFGGIIIHLIMFGIILIPFILLYILSVIELIYSLVKQGIKRNLIKFVTHLITILFISVILLIKTELLSSPRILTATMTSDLESYSLILRDNGKFEVETSAMFGYTKTYKGKFHQNGDTIIFNKQPADYNLIPDSIFLDKSQNAIFTEKDSTGNFIKEKHSLHFKILKKND